MQYSGALEFDTIQYIIPNHHKFLHLKFLEQLIVYPWL